MAVDLYFFYTTFYSQTVRLALEEKEIPYRQKVVNLLGGETQSPWYLRNVCASGHIPVIKHRGTFLSDCHAIIKYLDQHFEGRPLFPAKSTKEGKKIEELLERHSAECNMEVICYGTYIFPQLSDGMALPEPIRRSCAESVSGKGPVERFKRKMNTYPDMRDVYQKKLAFWKNFAKQVTDKECVEHAIDKCKIFFDYVEAKLSENDKVGHGDYFFCGETFNFADVILTVTLEKLRFLGLTKRIFIDGCHPYVALYYHRVLQRPSVQTVCVKGLSEATLIRTLLYFRLQTFVRPFMVVATVGTLTYFVWKYYRKF